jgi:hypothetical protein
MAIVAHLTALLAARPIVLWVEDAITKAYLERIWQPDDILFNILIGGGASSIRAVVHDLRADGYRYVFGLTDRDYDAPNVTQWNNPASALEVFRPTAFEIENHLLDWDALEGCGENQNRHRRTKAWITAEAEVQAQKMPWWMACRSVLAEYHLRMVGGFPRHPKIDAIQNLTQAETYIQTANGWHSGLQANVSQLLAPGVLTNDLQGAHGKWAQSLTDGSWKVHFSGREVFRVLRAKILDARGSTTAELDIDLAKSIADWQVTNHAVPAELVALKTALRTRVGV